MIKTFASRHTADLWAGKRVRAFDGIRHMAERKLATLDLATKLVDLSGLPGNRFEALRGDRQGQYSIRINDQWRICFRWHENDAYDVELVDYH